MFKLCCHSVCISEKSYFRSVNISESISHRSILLFQASRYRQFLHIAFARDVDIDCGTLVSREPQTRRLCKHSLNFSQCNKYHWAIGGDKEKEILY